MDKETREALDRAMAICSRSEKCVSDISDKLKSWGIDSDEKISLIIGNLKAEKFIDEKRYAAAYAREKHRFNHWGRIKIGMMLGAKGIGKPEIQEALGSIDEGLYRTVLKEEILKKRRTIKGTNQFEIKGKLMRFAQSKGYETNLIFDILTEIAGN